jgi:polysaccharide biosynthesis/export protein
MNSVFSLLPEGGWQRLLCDAIWQSTLIAGLGLLAARFLIRQSAARAWLLLLTVIACAAVPLASLAARQSGWGLFPHPQSTSGILPLSASAVAWSADHTAGSVLRGTEDLPSANHPGTADTQKSSPPDFTPIEIQASQAVESRSPDPATVASIPPSVTSFQPIGSWEILAPIWLFASAILIVRLIAGTIATHRLLRRAQRCDDQPLLAAAAEAARRAGLSRVPTILLSPSIETPTVFCLGRTKLLIPAASEQQNAKIDWTAAFTHELAHVARRDGWSRLLVELITIALPLQPLIWLARRAFRTACEEACDDCAVATGTSAVDLAETLTAWVKTKSPRAALAIGMSSTKARTLRLLSLREPPTAQLTRAWYWAAVSACLLLTTAIAVAQTRSSPKQSQAPVNPANTAPRKSAESAGTPAASKEPTGTAQPEDAIEKRIAEDSLVELYTRQLVDAKRVWEEAKAEAGDKESDGEKVTRTWYLKLRDKLDKRKTEIRPIIVEQLAEEQSHSQPKRADAERQDRVTPPTYVIEPPDILTLEPTRLVPKKPLRIAPFDKVKIAAEGTLFDAPLSGTFQVDSEGEVVLGAAYGAVKLTGLTRREAEEAVLSKLQEKLKEPQVALIIDESRLENGIKGDHLIEPDGTINLGAYGQAYVAGMTIPQASKAVETQLGGYFNNPKVSLDVKSFNSKVYYVIYSGAGDGDNIQRYPFKGSETVLDAIAQVPGLTGLSKAHIWIARPTAGAQEKTIRIDWPKALRGEDAANPQVLPGDRIFVTGATLLPGLPAGGGYRPTPSKSSSPPGGSNRPAGSSGSDNHTTLPPYVIEPPDILLVEAKQLMPKGPFHIEPLDILDVDVEGAPFDAPIHHGLYQIEPGGMLNLGAAYGKAKVDGLSLKEAAEAVTKVLKPHITDPRVSVKLNTSGGLQQITGQHLVDPDGTIDLGTYGQVHVGGMTIAEANAAIEKALAGYFVDPKVTVDLYASNSKVYYVITKGANGDDIRRFPATGNETVLDAVSQVAGVSRLSSKDITIHRPTSDGSEKILQVSWDEIVGEGGVMTNYQVLPGDRVIIKRREAGDSGGRAPSEDTQRKPPENRKTPPTFRTPDPIRESTRKSG